MVTKGFCGIGGHTVVSPNETQRAERTAPHERVTLAASRYGSSPTHATPRSSKLSFEIREAGRPSFRGEHFYRCAVALRHDTVGVTPGGPPL